MHGTQYNGISNMQLFVAFFGSVVTCRPTVLPRHRTHIRLVWNRTRTFYKEETSSLCHCCALLSGRRWRTTAGWERLVGTIRVGTVLVGGTVTTVATFLRIVPVGFGTGITVKGSAVAASQTPTVQFNAGKTKRVSTRLALVGIVALAVYHTRVFFTKYFPAVVAGRKASVLILARFAKQYPNFTNIVRLC